MLDKINGYKTYLVVALAAVWAIVGVMLGYLTVEQAVTIVLAALGTGGLRSAMKKLEE